MLVLMRIIKLNATHKMHDNDCSTNPTNAFKRYTNGFLCFDKPIDGDDDVIFVFGQC